MNYKAIIFDLDGTLVNSLADIACAANRALAKFGYPTHAEESYKYFVGRGLSVLAYQSLPADKRSDDNLADFLKVLSVEYSLSNEKSILYDGIAELLETLTSRGIRMSVLSNKVDEFTQDMCARLLGNWHFEIIMGASDRFPRKPDPTAALYIAQQLELSPSEILYLGDTNVDMQTATSAGMFAVGAAWGFRTSQELHESGAKMIINKPQELLVLL